MTCIVGFTNGETSWIGGDSFGSNGYSGQVYKNKKIFKLHDSSDIIAGYTTSFRMGQLLQYSEKLFDELSILKNKIDEKYMINTFIPNLQKLFHDGGFLRNSNGEKFGGNFLIAIKETIFEVQNDYSVLIPKNNFCSVGCGEDFSNASLYSLRNEDLTPEERITKALESAEHFSTGVKRPFHIINTDNDKIITID